MSLAGFKKQINKANQYMSEKIGGAKGTELDNDFHEMERKIDVTGKLVEELMARTHELLQPNPASRAKLSAVNTVSKFRGQAKNALYPQPEGQLGECMIKYGKELGEDGALGPCLIESGESFKQMADIKYALEDNVKQNFIEPLHHLQSQDLKQVNHHRKKMSGRRLDYDCKKRKQTRAGEEDIHMAEEKFEESKNLAEVAMFNLLENDVEQMSQLLSFSESYMNYHRQAADIMTALHETLSEKVNDAASRPRREHVPQRATSSTNISKSPMYEGSTANHNSFGNMDNTGYSLSPAQQTYTNNTNTDLRSMDNTAIYDNPLQYEQTGQSAGKRVGSVSGGYMGAQIGRTYGGPVGAIGGIMAGHTVGSKVGSQMGAQSGRKIDTVMSQPRTNQQVDLLAGLPSDDYISMSNQRYRPPIAAKRSSNSTGSQPCCRALYDFDPENEGELGFKEGDSIQLDRKIDENWYEGTVHGQSGFFPVNYVEVEVDLPNGSGY